MRAKPTARTWKALADRITAVEQARREKIELRNRQARARLRRGIIGSAGFLMLLIAGLMFSGHTLVNLEWGAPKAAPPAEDIAALSREKYRNGWIVHELSGGASCRYHRFDNFTGKIGGGTAGECEDTSSKRKAAPVSTFTWGN